MRRNTIKMNRRERNVEDGKKIKRHFATMYSV
jgi:hypothetical protein